MKKVFSFRKWFYYCLHRFGLKMVLNAIENFPWLEYDGLTQDEINKKFIDNGNNRPKEWFIEVDDE